MIGEAAKKISGEFKNNHPGIPWKIMTAMRNLLIHDYEGVSPYRIWDTILNDIPPLIEELKKIISGKS